MPMITSARTLSFQRLDGFLPQHFKALIIGAAHRVLEQVAIGDLAVRVLAGRLGRHHARAARKKESRERATDQVCIVTQPHSTALPL